MKSDILINQSASLKNINEITNKLNINNDDVIMYGKYKAKLELKDFKKQQSNLILVTAISPTPAGEGKSTTTIGLVDGLNKIGLNACGALREPSMGPVFGRKGGATGGGYSQIAPMEDINLHFTGDMHAITSANNLICACLDNHLHYGNELDIVVESISIKRAVDMNDRTLRDITIAKKKKVNGIEREDGFNISVASEIMAILCLSNDFADLRKRISKMIIAYNSKGEAVSVKDLEIVGSICVILKDAIKPNLVQTLENNPVFVHGGPFANIAHGCNSIIATKYALSCADYVVTEAGFGADLGSEKFVDIKCRTANLTPNLVVLVATVRSLKMHGGQDVDALDIENISNLRNGFKNLERHLEITSLYNVPVIVAINRFAHDTDQEIQVLQDLINELGYKSVINNSFVLGSEGAVDFANLVKDSINKDAKLNYVYKLEDSYEQKIFDICTKVYQASNVSYKEGVLDKIKQLNNDGYTGLAVCIAKTPNSFTGNSKILGAPTDFTIEISDVKLSLGSGFLVVYVGNILTMPGLPKFAQSQKIDIVNGKITGLS